MSVILIIDDVAAMRDQYAYDLARLGGFTTRTADGGSEGAPTGTSTPRAARKAATPSSRERPST